MLQKGNYKSGELTKASGASWYTYFQKILKVGRVDFRLGASWQWGELTCFPLDLHFRFRSSNAEIKQRLWKNIQQIK